MARSSPPTNPIVSVFSWGDDDEDTVTDYTAMTHETPNLDQEDKDSANSRLAPPSSESSCDSRPTSPEATLNPKISSRKSLPVKFSSKERSVNTLPKMASRSNENTVSDAEVFLPQLRESEEIENFDRDTIATSSFRSNSCPSYETAYPLKGKSATLKTFQSDIVFTNTKGKKFRHNSNVSMLSWKGLFNRSTHHDKDVSVYGSLENCEQLAQPSIPPENIQNFLTDDHTINQKMRQGDIYEIIQTERNQCIALAEVKKLFGEKNYRAILDDEVRILEHIEKIFSVHYAFHGCLRKMQGDGVYIERVGSAIHQFLTRVKQLNLDESYGLVSYYCTRAVKELPSRTPVQITGVPLRLTKFQIQLDSLLKHSDDESDRERKLIQKSLAMVKEILCSINEILDTKENDHLLKTLYRKIDPKSALYLDGIKFTKHDLLNNRRLLHHEHVKINVTQQKVHSVELLLFDDVLIFLQGTTSNKYQFYPTHADKNLIKLHSWIMREKAGTKTSVYLFSSNPNSSMLEVMTSSGSARTLLIKNLSTSIKNAKDKYQKVLHEKRQELQNIVELSYDVFKQKAEDCIRNITTTSSGSDKTSFRENFHSAAQLQLVSLRKVIHTGNQLLNELQSNSGVLEMEPNRLEGSIKTSIQKHFEEQNKFLELAVKLTEINCNIEPQAKFGENFDFDTKIEDLRVQHLMFVDEKTRTEERLHEEKTLLEEKATTLETKKNILDKRENDLLAREQELLVRRQLMDKYLGACISRNNKLVVERLLTPESLFNLVEQYDSMQKELTMLKSSCTENFPDGALQSDSQWNNMIPTHSMPNLAMNPRRVQFTEVSRADSSLQDISNNEFSPRTLNGCRSSMTDIPKGENRGKDFERAFPGDITVKTTKKTLKQRLASAVRGTLRSKKSKTKSVNDVNEASGSDLRTDLEKQLATYRSQAPSATGRKAEQAQVKQTLPKKLAD